MDAIVIVCHLVLAVVGLIAMAAVKVVLTKPTNASRIVKKYKFPYTL